MVEIYTGCNHLAATCISVEHSQVAHEDNHINSPLVVKFIRASSEPATNQHRFMLAAGLLILECWLITLRICEVLTQVS